MKKWYEITLNPRDVLFFRGGRPMEASTMGEGARWPMPSVFHHALLSAFHRTWPEYQPWEHRHVGGSDKNKKSSFRFGGLQTMGVFPHRDGKLYLPTPADIKYKEADSEELCLLTPQKPEGKGNLPKPLEFALYKPGGPSKRTLPQWMDIKSFSAYLQGNPVPLADAFIESTTTALFSTELRPGIAIDSKTLSTEEGQFYLAEYMRLREGVSMRGFAQCIQSRSVEKSKVNVMDKFLDKEKSHGVTMGGQQGVVHMEVGQESSGIEQLIELLPPNKNGGRWLKWVLLTPAVFTGGWLPSWINPESGEVTLYNKSPRKEGETRSDWRRRIKNGEMKKEVIATLKAACIPKPLYYSGWQSHGGNGTSGPKPTRLCVPAGGVYYFEVPKDGDSSKLWTYLNGQCKADIGAEKGYGLGVCGVWHPDNSN